MTKSELVWKLAEANRRLYHHEVEVTQSSANRAAKMAKAPTSGLDFDERVGFRPT